MLPNRFPRPSTRSYSAVLSLAAMIVATSAQAQSTTPTASETGGGDDIVVTATGFQQKQEDAPASVTVIDGADLRRRAIHNLADAVRDVEGVVVNGNANERDIQMRGMPGDYTLILVDGRRQSARESRVNGNRGYEQSLTPPAAAIERIEVVRGPMSSLYGSDAIGGVINVITRRPTPVWSGTLSYDYSLRQHGDQGNEGFVQGYISGPVIGGLLGVQAWSSYLGRAADDNVLVTNGFARARNRSATGRAVLTPAANQELILEGGVSRLRNGQGISPNWSTRQQDNNRDYWSLMHNGRWGRLASFLSYLDETSSREGLATPAQTDVFGRRPEVRNQVFDAKLVLPTTRNTTTIGVQWLRTGLRDWNQANRGKPNEREYERYSVVQRGIFAETEWRVLPGLSLTGGIRLDDHQKYGQHVNPRAYAVWHVTDRWTLKGGVARGFKAPELRAVIPDYAVVRRNRFVQFGNPDLKPESSTNYEATAMWSNRSGISAGATIFYNDFRDQLSTVTTSRRWEGLQVLDRINVNRASILGVEVSGRWRIDPAFSVRGNMTYLDSEQKSGPNKGAPLALTPKWKGNVRGDWDLSQATRLWTSINYYGREYQALITGGSAPAYLTADLLGSHDLGRGFRVQGGIYNVGDKRLDDATYGTVNYGRTFWMGVSANF
ncbi:outer membrane receptor for ferrienterochelin and colicins [Sphingomonas sp. SORGH_AS802]|uniref:TonB-dependent receptor domain-containing protein n=1 Tax=unclassified Sphingomonas TaxID=196159 RepID=UPI002854FE7A|nr:MULTISPECIES: TonB-dependent receptor [unclassified Sphingomonas]MDR6128299.1 outer membrane receptor for ferrienterochelin and colicins [Sphingomonas sp. SORGH_AS_0438]MDR6135497.1 outer membrane receptor for ferrienterochelin and colicins [Sphingomonas sp. SORGH_AS_0802]